MNLKRFILILFSLPFFVCGQSKSVVSKPTEEKLYAEAISGYIKSIEKDHPLNYDTLFVGPDEYLYDVVLPKELLGKKIHLLKGEGIGDKKMEYKKSFVYVNIIASITKSDAEFIFITFIAAKQNGNPSWVPQHNFIMDYKYNPKKEQYVMEKQRFDMQYIKQDQ